MLKASGSERCNFRNLPHQSQEAIKDRLNTDQDQYTTKESSQRDFIPSSLVASNSRKQSYASKHNLSSNQTNDVLNSDLIYPDSNLKEEIPLQSAKAIQERRINKVMLGPGNGLGKLLASSLLSSTSSYQKSKRKQRIKNEQKVLIQSTKKNLAQSEREDKVDPSNYSTLKMKNANSFSCTQQHQDNKKISLSFRNKSKVKRVQSGKRSKNNTPRLSPSSRKSSYTVIVQKSIDAQSNIKSDLNNKTPRLSNSTKKQLNTQQKIYKMYLSRQRTQALEQNKKQDANRKKLYKEEQAQNQPKIQKNSANKLQPPIVLDINQQLTPQSPIQDEKCITEKSDRFINIQENYQTAQFSPVGHYQSQIRQDIFEENSLIRNKIHNTFHPVEKQQNQQDLQFTKRSLQKPSKLKGKDQNITKLIEKAQSPIISSTFRSISPFSNSKQYSGSGYISARQLSEGKCNLNGQSYRVTDTLRKYEQALVHLEKENKQINSALASKIEEGIARNDQVLKLKAKNLQLLRKLRIKKVILTEIKFNQESVQRVNNEISPSVPNYLYSNPVKVLNYLKKTYGNGLTMRSSNANIISRQQSATMKQGDEFDKKRFSVGNLDEMMSLSMRPTNFQTYLAMKKYSQADLSVSKDKNNQKQPLEQISFLTQSTRILSNSQINPKREFYIQVSKDQSQKASNKVVESKLFSEATKKQVIKTRNAASNYKNQILPQKHEIVLI